MAHLNLALKEGELKWDQSCTIIYKEKEIDMKEENMKKRRYKGMKMIPIKGLGIRNNTKTYINGSGVRKTSSP